MNRRRWSDRHPHLYGCWESVQLFAVLAGVSAVLAGPLWVPQTFGAGR